MAKNIVAFIAIAVAILSIVMGISQNSDLASENQKLTDDLERMQRQVNDLRKAATEEEFEVADYMTKLQRFAAKYYYAGKAGNWKLAKFYLHEMEEAFEAIEHANVIEDGVSLSENIKTYGLKAIEYQEEKGVGAEQFGEVYEAMVSSCNSCHALTDHNYIVISAPKSESHFNQDFSVVAPN